MREMVFSIKSVNKMRNGKLKLTKPPPGGTPENSYRGVPTYSLNRDLISDQEIPYFSHPFSYFIIIIIITFIYSR